MSYDYSTVVLTIAVEISFWMDVIQDKTNIIFFLTNELYIYI